jgi:hypothetical protein
MDRIGHLERENLTLAKALKAAHRRIGEVEENAKALRETVKRNQESVQKYLAAEPQKPKIIAKPAAPKRVNWRQAREALEKASDSVHEEERALLGYWGSQEDQ